MTEPKNKKDKPPTTGLARLREPFDENQIGKLPKPTKAQTDEVKKDFKKGVRCEICKQWHHPKVIHLDYVGHAALTDRLLEVDPKWGWEPFSVDDRGQPCLLPDGKGMWIKLTILEVTRIGFGDAGKKSGGDAMKEIIGDALRNAGMRFGMALDLWHKGDLHGLGDNQPDEPEKKEEDIDPEFQDRLCDNWMNVMKEAAGGDIEEFFKWWKDCKDKVTGDCGKENAVKIHAEWNKIQKDMAKSASKLNVDL